MLPASELHSHEREDGWESVIKSMIWVCDRVQPNLNIESLMLNPVTAG